MSIFKMDSIYLKPLVKKMFIHSYSGDRFCCQCVDFKKSVFPGKKIFVAPFVKFLINHFMLFHIGFLCLYFLLPSVLKSNITIHLFIVLHGSLLYNVIKEHCLSVTVISCFLQGR